MVEYAYQWFTPYKKEHPTIVCLHGFTGTSNTFQTLKFSEAYNYLGIDLIGHGKTSVFVHPDHYQMTNVIRELQALLQHLAITSYYVLGYSMGGRVALAWGLTDENVKGIILENASPGLTTLPERTTRINKDNRLAQRLLTEPLGDFIDFWQALPLFDSQKQLSPKIQAKIRQERMSQQPYGLAMSLFMMGTGQQPSYWNQLETTIPLLYITGEWDHKFQEIARKMHIQQPAMHIHTVPNAGHCVHVEQPDMFLQLVENWLKEQLG